MCGVQLQESELFVRGHQQRRLPHNSGQDQTVGLDRAGGSSGRGGHGLLGDRLSGGGRGQRTVGLLRGRQERVQGDSATLFARRLHHRPLFRQLADVDRHESRLGL